MLREVEVPRGEPLTAERVKEIEGDARMIAVASVARFFVPESAEQQDDDLNEAEEVDKSDD